MGYLHLPPGVVFYHLLSAAVVISHQVGYSNLSLGEVLTYPASCGIYISHQVGINISCQLWVLTSASCGTYISRQSINICQLWYLYLSPGGVLTWSPVPAKWMHTGFSGVFHFRGNTISNLKTTNQNTLLNICHSRSWKTEISVQ